jgi:methionyl-tRNA synthetase
VLAEIAAGFETVGDAIGQARFRQAIAEAMRLSSRANEYVAAQAPWQLVKTDRDRAATVLYVALRLVDDLKTIFAPFLPFSSQKVHELLGYDGWLAGPLDIREVGAEGDRHEILTGDYAGWTGSWASGELPPGRPLPEPQPLFRKLDPRLVEEELARLGAA